MALLTGSLLTFKAARWFLWHRGIGARFFHYTRYLAIPVYVLSVLYNFYFVGLRLMREADCLDYFLKNGRLKKHHAAAKRVVDARVDYMKAVEEGKKASICIDELVNGRN